VGVGDKWGHVLPEIVKHRHDQVHLGNTWPLRDYIHVEDVADALQFLARKAPTGFSEWNVGTGIGTNVVDLVTLVAALSGVAITPMVYAGKVRADDGHLVANPEKLSALGWSATRTLTDAIRELVATSDPPTGRGSPVDTGPLMPR
jgi:UDP-glucose 4-epimerase